jgi:small subunit ribosomal protein S6
MVRDYELMYIVRPDLDEEGLAAAMQSVHALVEGQGGEVVRTTAWGKRRLAYEIERMRDGHYVLLHIRLDSARVKEIERLLHIHDTVFRHLVTVWVESKGKDGEEAEDDLIAEAGRGRAGGPASGALDEDEPLLAEDDGVPVAVGGRRGRDDDDEDEIDAYPAAEEDE